MFNLEKILFVCIIFGFSLLIGVKSERIVVRDQSNSEYDHINAKLDLILSKLNQLSHTGTCTRLCSEDYRNLQQKFLSAETISKSTAPNSLNSANTQCTTYKFCQKNGVIDASLQNGKKSIKLLCDTEHWIVLLQRFDGSVSFHNKNWAAYKNGFGTVGATTEFFLGLQNIHDLTSTAAYELRIELEDFNGLKAVAQYSDFSVGDEESAFKLYSLGVYSGNAGDSFKYHEGQSFSTLDRDNDAKAIGSCSEEFNSAGWFKACMEANLMGSYGRGDQTNFKEGLYWETFRGPEYSLKSVKMSIRSKC